MSLKLEQFPYEFEGKTYILSCNMSVLETIQEAHNGDLGEALDPDRSIKSALEFLTAMLNDYADEQGWPERYTQKQVSRRLSFGGLTELTNQIMGMVVRSMAVPGKTPQNSAPDDNPPENSGN